jgi:RNA polymerase sigma factor (TIGR02999 family)
LTKECIVLHEDCVLLESRVLSLPRVAAEQGNPATARALFPTLYGELHTMAERLGAGRGGPINLGATTLLHEAYIDMAGRIGPTFPDSSRFLGYAARVMRGMIIDHARSRRVQKRGGHFEITWLDTDPPENPSDSRELTLIGEALDELAGIDASLAELVDLRFFCGFSFAEIAVMRNVSERTLQRNWERARIYLHRSMRPDLSL